MFYVGVICGVGINDMKNYATRSFSEYNYRVYRVWKHIIERCYSGDISIKNRCYLDCKVCDRWKLLSNFVKDIEYIPGYNNWVKHIGEGLYFLDKDTRYCGNKVYDPSTVCFILASKSSKEVNRRSKGRKVLADYKGVHYECDSILTLSQEIGLPYSTVRNNLYSEYNYINIRYKEE